MERTLKRIALAGAFLVPLAAAPAHAQGPTPEGTVITNQATASWTDANNNTYTPATASVSVTVGFVAAPDVEGPATAAPGSPSTGNTAAYTITNRGNGADQFSLAFDVESGLTVTGYAIGSTAFPTLAALNAELAATSIAQNGTVTVTVTYTVEAAQGGQNLSIKPTATSARDNTKKDQTETVVTPPVSETVTTTIGGGGGSGGVSTGTATRLPSNGTTYTETFTVTNGGNATGTFTLTPGSSNGTVATVSGISGTGVTGGQVTLAAGASVTVTLTYTVHSVPAGSTSGLTLTSTSATNSAVTSTGTVNLTVIRAAVAMTKAAYRADRATAITAPATVAPGETFYYLITVNNTGQAVASSVSVADVIPAQFRTGFTAARASDNVGDFNFTYDAATSTLTAALNGTLAVSGGAGDTASFWIQVTLP